VLPCGSGLALTSNHILNDEKKDERTKKIEFVYVTKKWGGKEWRKCDAKNMPLPPRYS
jgi:hypothetical protein